LTLFYNEILCWAEKLDEYSQVILLPNANMPTVPAAGERSREKKRLNENTK
jgi:hypothetical protein